MSQLIISLAQAHAALLAEAGKNTPQSPSLLSTARKVESTLLDSLKSADDKTLNTCAIPIMNSGSLKALKLLLITDTALSNFYGSPSLDVAFILNQPASYLREAMKRGFRLGRTLRLDYLRSLGKATDHHSRLQGEALVLNGDYSMDFLNSSLEVLQGLPEEEARNVAPFVGKLIKACAKANPEKFQSSFEVMVGIHDPGAAHEHLMRKIALYGLIGAKAPPAHVFEHDDMRRLARAVTSGPGKKELLETFGSLEGYLVSGLRAPQGLVAELERQRRFWQPPRAPRSRHSRY